MLSFISLMSFFCRLLPCLFSTFIFTSLFIHYTVIRLYIMLFSNAFYLFIYFYSSTSISLYTHSLFLFSPFSFFSSLFSSSYSCLSQFFLSFDSFIVSRIQMVSTLFFPFLKFLFSLFLHFPFISLTFPFPRFYTFLSFP